MFGENGARAFCATFPKLGQSPHPSAPPTPSPLKGRRDEEAAYASGSLFGAVTLPAPAPKMRPAIMPVATCSKRGRGRGERRRQRRACSWWEDRARRALAPLLPSPRAGDSGARPSDGWTKRASLALLQLSGHGGRIPLLQAR